LSGTPADNITEAAECRRVCSPTEEGSPARLAAAFKARIALRGSQGSPSSVVNRHQRPARAARCLSYYRLMRSVPSARGRPIGSCAFGPSRRGPGRASHTLFRVAVSLAAGPLPRLVRPEGRPLPGANCAARDLSRCRSSRGHRVGKSLFLSWLLSRCLKGQLVVRMGPVERVTRIELA
jgi:hypothetical protein